MALEIFYVQLLNGNETSVNRNFIWNNLNETIPVVLKTPESLHQSVR